MIMKDSWDGWMIDEFGFYRSYIKKKVYVLPDRIVKEVRFVKGTGMYYFNTRQNEWFNYEPHQVESMDINLLTKG